MNDSPAVNPAKGFGDLDGKARKLLDRHLRPEPQRQRLFFAGKKAERRVQMIDNDAHGHTHIVLPKRFKDGQLVGKRMLSGIAGKPRSANRQQHRPIVGLAQRPVQRACPVFCELFADRVAKKMHGNDVVIVLSTAFANSDPNYRRVW